MLEGEKSALFRKGVDLALDGDVQMLKLFLGRLLPRDRLVNFDLPKLQFADDGVAAIARIAEAVSVGEISPSEGADLAALVNSWAQAIDLADVVKRIDTLEAELRTRRIIS
jgi:hypothetical protein